MSKPRPPYEAQYLHAILPIEGHMEEIAISKFKATCLEVLERVRKTRKAVLVTRFGIPVAQVTPPSVSKPKSNWLGSMAGTARIKGGLVAPAADSDDWDVFHK